jgi:hypothetical protein
MISLILMGYKQQTSVLFRKRLSSVLTENLLDSLVATISEENYGMRTLVAMYQNKLYSCNVILFRK